MTDIHVPAFFYEAGRKGVLLIHGFTASPAEMHALGLYLHRHDLTCLGVRLAGHGTTEQDLASTTWQNWYDSVNEALSDLEQHCEQVFVAGLSMGGLLASLLASENPHRIHRLALLCPAFFPHSPFLFLAPWLRPFYGAVHKSEASRAYLAKHELFSYPSMPLPALVQLYKLIKIARSKLPHITMPTQIFMGKRDRTVEVTSALHLFNALGSSAKHLIYLPASGHILTVEPDAPLLFQALEHFFSTAIST